MKKIQNSFKLLFMFIIGALCSGITVYASYQYMANEVSYTPADSNWNVSSVEEALNELHHKLNNKTSDYEILFTKKGLNASVDYKIQEKDLGYKNLLVIVNTVNTAQSNYPASFSVTNDHIVPISNGDTYAYTEYGIYTTRKLYIGIINDIILDDVIHIVGSYAYEIVILGMG